MSSQYVKRRSEARAAVAAGIGDFDPTDLSWMKQASCAGADPAQFEGRKTNTEILRTYCYWCPVWDSCLMYALVNHLDEDMTYGGMAPISRSKLVGWVERRGTKVREYPDDVPLCSEPDCWSPNKAQGLCMAHDKRRKRRKSA